MAVVRTNPLPAGRYWVYIFRAQFPKWNEWRDAHLQRRVLTIEAQEGEPERLLPGNIPWDRLDNLAKVESIWVLFRTSEPTEWPQVELGFPTIADDESVTSRVDVEQAPPPGPDIDETIENAVDRVGNSIENMVFAALVIWGISRVLKD